MVRLKITRQPRGTVDGIDLDHFHVGFVYDVGSQIASLLLAERWAEPVDDRYRALVTPVTDGQQFAERSKHRRAVGIPNRQMARDAAADRSSRRERKSWP